MKGKIEMLKQKTKCHICRRQGHWKKECPMRKGATDKETATKTKEVHIVDDDEDDEYLDAYILEGIKQEEPPGNHHQKTGQVKIEEKEERQLRQKKDYWTLTDDGKFVIRHHVRSRKCLFTPHQVQGMPVDVTSLTGKRITEVKGFDESIEDNYKTSPEPHRNLGKPWIGSTSFEITGREAAPMENCDQVAVTMSHDELDGEMIEAFEAEVLRGGVAELSGHFAPKHASLSEHAVPDTACRKTPVGEYTLHGLESECILRSRGLKVLRHGEVNDFKFGNAGTLRSHEVAQIPISLGDRRLVVQAAVLPGTGSKTPFLLSKESLKHLGCVLDTENDVVSFKKLKQRIQMGRTEKGHYAIPILARRNEWHQHRRSPESQETSSAEGPIVLQECHVAYGIDDVTAGKAAGRELGVRQNREWLCGQGGAGPMERSRDRRTTGASVRKNQVDVGKYARMTEMTMGKAYVTDKKYVKWVRHNIKTEGSTPGMRKFRLYVELRDQTKSERIHGTMGLGMTGTQMPVPAMPKRMAKSKAAPSDPRAHQGYMTPPSVNHRRPREGEGWGAEMPENLMDTQEWEQITEDPDATDELQGEWILMISESHHDPTKVNQMNQVLQVMGIRKAVEMFKAIDHFD